MKLARLSVAATAALILLTASASAAPVMTTKPTTGDSQLINVQMRGHGHAGPVRRGGPRYVPGRRYSSAPHGWRRYGARPGDWRTRGCVMVGPIWFCP